jgi:hypothetical protein
MMVNRVLIDSLKKADASNNANNDSVIFTGKSNDKMDKIKSENGATSVKLKDSLNNYIKKYLKENSITVLTKASEVRIMDDTSYIKSK